MLFPHEGKGRAPSRTADVDVALLYIDVVPHFVEASEEGGGQVIRAGAGEGLNGYDAVRACHQRPVRTGRYGGAGRTASPSAPSNLRRR